VEMRKPWLDKTIVESLHASHAHQHSFFPFLGSKACPMHRLTPQDVPTKHSRDELTHHHHHPSMSTQSQQANPPLPPSLPLLLPVFLAHILPWHTVLRKGPPSPLARSRPPRGQPPRGGKLPPLLFSPTSSCVRAAAAVAPATATPLP